MKILRYEIKQSKEHPKLSGVILMPKAARVVDAVWQPLRDAFSVYAEVDDAEAERDKHNLRKFRVYATGDDIGKRGEQAHIRSIVMPDGITVFHIYEV